MEVGIAALHVRRCKRSGLRRFALAAIIFLVFAAVFDSQPVVAKEEPMYIQVANSAMARWPEGRFATAGMPVEWNFQLGALLAGINAVWERTGDRAYLNYIQSSIDQFVQPDGSIRT